MLRAGSNKQWATSTMIGWSRLLRGCLDRGCGLGGKRGDLQRVGPDPGQPITAGCPNPRVLPPQYAPAHLSPAPASKSSRRDGAQCRSRYHQRRALPRSGRTGQAAKLATPPAAHNQNCGGLFAPCRSQLSLAPRKGWRGHANQVSSSGGRAYIMRRAVRFMVGVPVLTTALRMCLAATPQDHELGAKRLQANMDVREHICPLIAQD